MTLEDFKARIDMTRIKDFGAIENSSSILVEIVFKNEVTLRLEGKSLDGLLDALDGLVRRTPTANPFSVKGTPIRH